MTSVATHVVRFLRSLKGTQVTIKFKDGVVVTGVMAGVTNHGKRLALRDAVLRGENREEETAPMMFVLFTGVYYCRLPKTNHTELIFKEAHLRRRQYSGNDEDEFSDEAYSPLSQSLEDLLSEQLANMEGPSTAQGHAEESQGAATSEGADEGASWDDASESAVSRGMGARGGDGTDMESQGRGAGVRARDTTGRARGTTGRGRGTTGRGRGAGGSGHQVQESAMAYHGWDAPGRRVFFYHE